MTMETQQNVLGITEAYIATVDVNTKENYTKGEEIELPDLSSLEITKTTEEKEAKAGLRIADSFTLTTGFEVKFENVNIPLDVIAKINGSTLTQSGTTPDQTNVLIDAESDVPAMFNLRAKTDLINGQAAEMEVEMYCVKGILDVVTTADDYWTCSFEGKAFARKKDGHYRAIKAVETAGTEIDET